MAKFDHRINLPQIFSDNNLAILPISRGDYIISHFSAYHSFEPTEDRAQNLSLPAHIQSLDANNVPSETVAINCALASGILSDFLEEDTLCSTVSGRMGSGNFDFKILNTATNSLSAVQVSNSQIEIDAAFEGIESLALIEAKLDLSDDFLVRQLYYPFRVWRERITKKVRPIFLVYSNGIYNLYEYEFKDPDEYNSLALIKSKNYSIEDTIIEMSDLLGVAERITTFATEPDIPFPQADSFERVINLCELIGTNTVNSEEITDNYAFDARQTKYYSDAARYLGLINKFSEDRKPFFALSSLGKSIMNLSYKQRQLAFCQIILEHKAFHDTFSLWLSQGSVPEKKDVVQIMRQANLFNMDSESTYHRRASTVRRWINWILGLIQE